MPNGHTYHAGRTPAMAAQEEVRRARAALGGISDAKGPLDVVRGVMNADGRLRLALEHLALLVEYDRKELAE